MPMMFALALLAAGPAETWIVRVDLWGNPAFSTLTLTRDGARLSGDLDGDRLSGAATGSRLRFDATDRRGGESHFAGTVAGDRMTGSVDAPDTNDPKARAAHAFTAWRVPARPAPTARRGRTGV